MSYADLSLGSSFYEMHYSEQKKEDDDIIFEHCNNYMFYCDAWHYKNAYEPRTALSQLLELLRIELKDTYEYVSLSNRDSDMRMLNMGCGRLKDQHDPLFAQFFDVSEIVNADLFKHDNSVTKTDPEKYALGLFSLEVNMLSHYPNEKNAIIRARESYNALEEGGVLICCNLEVAEADILDDFVVELGRLGMRALVCRLIKLNDQDHVVYVGCKVPLLVFVTLLLLTTIHIDICTIIGQVAYKDRNLYCF